MKVWICLEGQDDSEAIQVAMEDDAVVSDLLVRAPSVLSLGSLRASELQLVCREAVAGNRTALRGLLQSAEALIVRRRPTAGGAAAHGNDAAADSTAVLAEHFRLEALRRVEPWRVALHMHESIFEQVRKQTSEQKQAMFLDLARNGLLSPEDVLTGTYLLYGCKEDLEMYSGLSLRLSGHKRVVAHNWFVARQQEPAFVQIHGEIISKLQWPLFPPHPEFSAINQRLLTECAEVSGGAAQARSFVPSVYRRRDPSGGSFFAPVIDVGGQAAVDLGPAEDAVLALQQRLVALERQNAELQRKVQSTAAQPHSARAPSQHEHQTRSQQQASPDAAVRSTHSQRFARTARQRRIPAGGEAPMTSSVATAGDKPDF